jgi:hypothetical protein
LQVPEQGMRPPEPEEADAEDELADVSSLSGTSQSSTQLASATATSVAAATLLADLQEARGGTGKGAG